MTQESELVIVSVARGLGRLTLNRPDASNALTLSTIRQLTKALRSWRSDPGVEAVLIDHSGGRAFCAGGDAVGLAESAAGDGVWACGYLAEQYRLNSLLFHFPKPVVVLADGAILGGGLGLCLPSRFRVATGNTSLAFAETSVGMVPDVGASWFLSRLSGGTGAWLALTGSRIKSADCRRLGLTTHHIPSERLAEVVARIAAEPGRLEQTLADADEAPGAAPLLDRAAVIAQCFSASGLGAIVDALAKNGSDWAAQQRELILAKPPLAGSAALRELEIASGFASFDEALALEFRVSSRLLLRHDFRDWVRAFMIDKDNHPVWVPAEISDITAADMDALTAVGEPSAEWSPEV